MGYKSRDAEIWLFLHVREAEFVRLIQYKPMKSIYLSIIIPAYNEAERITGTLRSIDAYLRNGIIPYEILVVNDGSTDSTASVVTDLVPEIAHLKLVNNTENHGKGWVVRQGMLEATGEYRLFMDADGSTSIDHIDAFLEEAKKGYEVIISSRKLADSVVPVKQSPIRQFLGRVFQKMIQIIVPLGISDSQNGFKLFSQTAAEYIFSKQRTFTWAFDVEILAIARLSQFKIKELPVTYVDDARSKMTTKGMVRMLKEVIQVKTNLLRASYGTNDTYFGDPRFVILTKFVIFGAINTIVDWSWYIALSRSFNIFADHIILTKGLAFIIASIPVLVGNVYWVFPKRTFSMRDQFKLYSILALAFVINTASISVLVQWGMHDIAAIIVASGISFVWNFGMAWFFLIKDTLLPSHVAPSFDMERAA